MSPDPEPSWVIDLSFWSMGWLALPCLNKSWEYYGWASKNSNWLLSVYLPPSSAFCSHCFCYSSQTVVPVTPFLFSVNKDTPFRFQLKYYFICLPPSPLLNYLELSPFRVSLCNFLFPPLHLPYIFLQRLCHGLIYMVICLPILVWFIVVSLALESGSGAE